MNESDISNTMSMHTCLGSTILGKCTCPSLFMCITSARGLRLRMATRRFQLRRAVSGLTVFYTMIMNLHCKYGADLHA